MQEKKTFPLVTVLLLIGAFGFAFHHLWNILIPFILSLAAAYILMPAINAVQARGLRREVGVLLIYAAAAALLFLLASSLAQLAYTELQALQAEAPALIARLKQFAGGLQARAAAKVPFGADVIKELDARALAPLLEKAQSVPGYILGLFPVLSLLILVPFITFFLLLDSGSNVESMIQALPSRLVEQALHLLAEIDTSLGNYLRGLILVALAITAASFVGLVVLGVDQALWIALLSGISSFVPYLGAIIGALVGGLMASFQFGTALAGLKVVALFTGIRLADELVLQPLVARHSVHLHPLIFLLTFMIGGDLFGFLGLLFAVPAACVIKALVRVAWAYYSSERQFQPSPAFDLAELPYT
jgi:predicted PurR-regulated permease PerM